MGVATIGRITKIECYHSPQQRRRNIPMKTDPKGKFRWIVVSDMKYGGMSEVTYLVPNKKSPV